jgi:GNAT superfamily N-acetyltransferase
MNIEYAEPIDIDAEALARLHVESWRSAYRGILPDAFLDGSLEENRLQLWRQRAALPSDQRPLVLTARLDAVLVGFACVFPGADGRWGALLDNLHVLPELRGQRIGARLFEMARRRPYAAGANGRLYLWVLEANAGARRFYERHGGVPADRIIADVATGIKAAEVRYVWFGL